MDLPVSFAPFVLFAIAVLPAMLAYRVAKQQGRSKLATTAITFMLGVITWIGGWLYLAFINRAKPEAS